MDPTVAAAYAAQLQDYFGSQQRYRTKQNLQDQADLQQLQAGIAMANTNVDPAARTAASAQALQTYAQQYAAPSNSPSFPTAAEANTNLPSLSSAVPGRPSVTNVLSGQQFLPFQGLLSGLNVQPTVSDRSAIITSAGDVATESIFRHFMGSTNLSAENAEDNVFFGFSTVSVNPGWRTTKGWVAEAIMTAEVSYQCARESVLDRYVNAYANSSPLTMVKLCRDMNYPLKTSFLVNKYFYVPYEGEVTNHLIKNSGLTEAAITNFVEQVASNNPIFRQVKDRLLSFALFAWTRSKTAKLGLVQQTNVIQVAASRFSQTNHVIEYAMAVQELTNMVANATSEKDLEDVKSKVLEPLNATSPGERSNVISVVESTIDVVRSTKGWQTNKNFRVSALQKFVKTNNIKLEPFLIDTNSFDVGKRKLINELESSTNLMAEATNFNRLPTHNSPVLSNYLAAFSTAVAEHAYFAVQSNRASAILEAKHWYDATNDPSPLFSGVTLWVKDLFGETNNFPSLRTSEGFEICPCDTNFPVPVTVISPLIDSDVLDLSSSSRYQSEFALALSFALRYAGMAGSANAFEQFVKNNQFDVHTRAAQVAVNAFSGVDGRFGFQIGPRLKALGDPSDKKSKPSQTLERQSFPALVILRLGDGDLAARLYPVDGTSLVLYEPSLHFTQIRRWSPLKHSFARDFPALSPEHWIHPELTERRRLMAVDQLSDARRGLNDINNSRKLQRSVYNAILKRIENLESQMVGGESGILLSASLLVIEPKTNPTITISKIVPSAFTIDTNKQTELSCVLFGTGLDLIKVGSTGTNASLFTLIRPALGVDTTKLVLARNGQSLVLTFTLNAGYSNGPLVFKFEASSGTSVIAPPIEVEHVPAKGPSNTPPSIVFTETKFDETNKLSTLEYRVTSSTNASDAYVNAAVALIRADLEKRKPTADSTSNTVLKVLVADAKSANASISATAGITNVSPHSPTTRPSK
jgi:hypothetical protein